MDEANNLNEKFKNQISSQVDKIKSLEEQLVESKTEVEKLTSTKLVVEPNLKEKDFYIPPFKMNNEELNANIARIDKGTQSDVNAEVSKPMSKCTCPRLDLLLGSRVALKLLMFVTIVVVLVMLALIVSSYFLINKCPIGLILYLKALCTYSW